MKIFRLRNQRRRAAHTMLMLTVAWAVSGCGFHLRSAASLALPEALADLHVVVQDSKLSNDALLLAVKNALESIPNVRVTKEPNVSTLLLYGERITSQVLSVGSGGQVRGYVLRYEVNFRVTDARGKEILAPQSIRLVNDYTFDPLNVLAKEAEEQDLRRSMQREAVQQIVRRLSRAKPAEPKPDAKTEPKPVD